MLRRVLPLVVLLPLTGCALPPALAIASYAADGVLLLASGKTSTDHLLSMAEKRDCAVWRVVKGQAICQDFAGGVDPYENWRDPGEVQVAMDSTDAGFPTNLADDMRRRDEAMRQAQIARQEKAERIQLAQAAAGQPVTSARDIVGPSNRTMSDVSTAPLPPVAAPPAPSQAQPAPVSPAIVQPQPAPPAVAPPAVAPVIAAPAPKAAPPAHTAKAPTPAKGKTYVVLGSYKVDANAKRVAQQHQALKPKMQTVTVQGERYTRVVAGPYSPSEAAAIKQRLKSQSIDAFTAADCTGKPAGRCIDGSEG